MLLKLLENFKELMIEDEEKKIINTSELFERYCKYVAANVDTSDLEVLTNYIVSGLFFRPLPCNTNCQ